MSTQPVDYDALAEQARKVSSPVDYDALADQARGVSAAPAKVPGAMVQPDATIQPAKPRGFLDSLLEIPKQGAMGHALGISTETQAKRDEDPSNPVLRFEAALPPSGGGVAGGVARGAAKFASGLTTPSSLMLLGLTGGVGTVGAKLVHEAVPKLISLGFSADMISNAVKESPRAWQQIQDGDWSGAAETMTQMGLGVGMGIAAAKHGGAAEPYKPTATPTMVRDVQATEPPPQAYDPQTYSAPAPPDVAPTPKPPAPAESPYSVPAPFDTNEPSPYRFPAAPRPGLADLAVKPEVQEAPSRWSFKENENDSNGYLDLPTGDEESVGKAWVSKEFPNRSRSKYQAFAAGGKFIGKFDTFTLAKEAAEKFVDAQEAPPQAAPVAAPVRPVSEEATPAPPVEAGPAGGQAPLRTEEVVENPKAMEPPPTSDLSDLAVAPPADYDALAEQARANPIPLPQPVSLSAMGVDAIGEQAGRFYEADIKPALENLWDSTKSAATAITDFLAPRFHSKGETQDVAYEMKGRTTEQGWLAQRALDGFQKIVQPMKNKQKVELVDSIMRGDEQPNPVLNDFAQVTRALSDAAYAADNAYRPLSYLEDFWHIAWRKKPVIAGEEASAIEPKEGSGAIGAAPLLGSQSFAKQKFFKLWSDGLKWKLEMPADEFVRIATEARRHPDDLDIVPTADGVEVTPYNSKTRDWLTKQADKLERQDVRVAQRGGLPTTWDPLDMFVAGYVDSMKFANMNRAWYQMAELDMRRFVRDPRKAPEGFEKLNDRIAKVVFKGDQGLVQAGEWYVRNDMARMLNAYVSKDAIRGNKMGRFLLGVKNGTTAIELSMSPFHLMFVGNEAIASTVALGLRQGFHGATNAIFEGNVKEGLAEMGEGAWNMAKAPLSGIPMLAGRRGGLSNYGAMGKEVFAKAGTAAARIRDLGETVTKLEGKLSQMKEGNPLIKSTADQISRAKADIQAAQGDYDGAVREFSQTKAGKSLFEKYPDVVDAAHEYVMAGGKFHMDEGYRLSVTTSFTKAMKNEWRESNIPGSVARAIPAINEQLMKPLFEEFIPNIKFGSFLRERAQTVREYSHDLERGTVTQELLNRRVVESIENRFGEMNFDNLWWNRTMKTALQILLRSVTWKLGNVRETGNAALGVGRTAQSLYEGAKHGEAARLDPATAWAIGTAVLTTTLGLAINTFLGKQDPKTILYKAIHGDINAILNPIIDSATGMRVSMATYARDWQHLAHAGPVNYLASSLSGFLGSAYRLKQNRTYSGKEIYSEDDPWYEKGWDIVTGSMPQQFIFQGYRQAKSEGRPLVGQISGVFGYPKAPAWVQHTPAENLATEYMMSHRDPGARTSYEAARAELKGAIVRRMKAGLDLGELEDRMNTTFSRAEQNQMRQRLGLTDLQQAMSSQGVHPDEVIRVYEAATPEERASILPQVQKRLNSALMNHHMELTPLLWRRLQQLGIATATAPMPRVQ